MQMRRFLPACLLASSLIAGPIWAQEGHPLKGSWLGDWGASKTQRTQVFMVLDWDGKNITGTINPGPDAIPIAKATLELKRPPAPPGAPAAAAAPPRGAGAPPAQTAPGGQPGAGGQGGQGGGGGRGGGQGGGRGQAAPPPPLEDWLVHIEADSKGVHYQIDGKVENLGLYNRALVGTWQQGNQKGDFKLTRQ